MAMPPPSPSIQPNKGGLISTLTPNDVLSGHGKLVSSHPGNIRFLTRIVPEYVEEYCHPTTTRTEKAHVVARLVNDVRSRSNPPGRFLMGCKDNAGHYFEIGDEKAWKKAAKALQDASKQNTNSTANDITSVHANSIQGKPKSQSSKKNKKRQSKEASISHQQQHWQQSGSGRRLVILRPSSNCGNDDEHDDRNIVSSQHEHEQWPLYHQLCRSYGFAVEVEQFLEPYKVNEVADQFPRHDEVGPTINNLLLVDNNSCFVMGNFSARYGVVDRGGDFVRLRRIGERLSVRLLACSSSTNGNKTRKSSSLTGSKGRTSGYAKNAVLHHPSNLNDGDIIQTLDGKPDPTFAMLYGMMCRKEKLVLEVIHGEASASSANRGERGGEHIEHSSVGLKAARKPRKQPVPEGEDVTVDLTRTDASNAHGNNAKKSNNVAGSKKWNAAAALKATRELISDDKESEHFIREIGQTNVALQLTVPEEGHCAGDNKNGANDVTLTATDTVRKARNQSVTEIGHEMARNDVSNANNSNPRKTNYSGSKKWETTAAQKAVQQLLIATDDDNFIKDMRARTNSLHGNPTSEEATVIAGSNGSGNNCSGSSTAPDVVRNARRKFDANREQVGMEMGVTIDASNADDTIPVQTDFAGSIRKEAINGACSSIIAIARITERGTSSQNECNTTLERTASASGDERTHSTYNADTEREHVQKEIGTTGDVRFPEDSIPRCRSIDSDLSELEILPIKTHREDICNETKLTSRWGALPGGSGSNPYEMEKLNSNLLSSTMNITVRDPEASQLNRRDIDEKGINIPRARDTSCKASYDSGRMEDELFNMVEEDLSREQQPTSSLLVAPPSLNSAAPSEDLSKLTATGSNSASDIVATSRTGANDQRLLTDKLVSISSPSPPTLFDCTGDDGNSVSVSSCPSSSSTRSTSSTSSSESSGSRNDSRAQPTIPISQTGALTNNTSLGSINNVTTYKTHAHSKPSRKRPSAAVMSIGPPKAISARSSTSLPKNDGIVAPTSLSRLWPDPSDIIKALTRWVPPVAQVRKTSRDGRQIVEFYGPIRLSNNYINGSGNEQSRYNPLLQTNCLRRNGEAPREFKNADEVMDVMASTILNEGLHSINGDYHAEKYSNGRWNRCSYQMRMTKLTEVSPIFQSKSYFDSSIKLYEAQFSAHGETNIPPSNLSELYCMHFSGWDCSKFGIVAHDFPTTISFRTYNEGKSLLKLWLVVHQNEQNTKETGWLSRTDFKELLDPYQNDLTVKQNTIVTLISCGSTTNVVRQFEAMKCLPYLKPHLQRALFSSYNTSVPTSTATTKPRSLPIDVWHHLKSSHNSYQLSAVSKLLAGSCRENVCLVQGPPGTGKSSTIVGLVSALLSGKAPLPQQRQSGCLIHPGKTMGTTFAEPLARNRILVCATTNQAVDSLAWKIKQGSVGPSGKVGDFTMARYGSLPWEHSRNLSDQKPETLSSMEDFLYEINVDRRACDGMQDFEYYDEEHEHMSWSPEKVKPQLKKRRKVVGRAKVRSQVLGSCSVVITTLSGAGSKAFIDAVCRDPTRNDSEFDAVIIDEACQASEPESLIPFKYNPTTITLVGDPQQLPVLTLSGSSTGNKLYERSLFERLQSLNFPTILLRNQYRMHEDIAAFPSHQFYQDKLITPNSVKDRPIPSWATCPCFPTVCFWDTNGRNMPNNGSRGFRNNQEVEFITRTILSTFAHTFLSRPDEVVNVGIISFYRDQVQLLTEQVAKIPVLNNSMMNIKVATVDGFQGSECDIVILSCVRSHSHVRDGPRGNNVGFLNDYRRVNVALTRAKYSLWIVGNAEILNTSELWWKLLQDMDRRRVLRRDDEFKDIFAKWKSMNDSR